MSNNYETMEREELINELKKIKNEYDKLKSKKYGLIWTEIEEKFDEESKNKTPVLKEETSFRINELKESSHNHVLIEGDNYHALTTLQYTHSNKIDVIYIDPPYNTGNKDFVYNDSFVDSEDIYKHSKWLSFMNKRLKLAKSLLKSGGVIFISIDDNEHSQLKLLCDNIFGEKNFLGNIIWKSKGGSGTDATNLSIETEYILGYSNGVTLLNREEKDLKGYDLIDEHVETRGKYKLNKLDRGSLGYVKSLDFPIETNGLIAVPGGSRNHLKTWRWRWSKKKVEWGIENDFIVLKKDKNKEEVNAYYKIYENCDNEGNIIKRNYPYSNVIPENLCSTSTGTNELKKIFNNKKVFDYPKSTTLIKYLLKIATKKDSIILDFFAGSGTTGHAVLELNKNDGGNRQFILCTNNELSINKKEHKNIFNYFEENKIKEGDEEYERYGICQYITYPRIKKVIQGYETPNNKFVEGIPSNLKYYKTNFINGDINGNIEYKDRLNLAREMSEMIALRENTHLNIDKFNTDFYILYTDNNKITAIYFEEDKSKLEELKEILKDLNRVTVLYIYSYSKKEYESDFSDLDFVTLEDIPEPLIEIYKKIYGGVK